MRPLSPHDRATGGDLSPSATGECRLVVATVSEATGVDFSDFFASSRLGMPTSRARQLAMYLCHVLLGLTMTQVGQFFRRDRTTVAHACAQIEDSREDRRVDKEIQALEDRISRERESLSYGSMRRDWTGHGGAYA